MLISTHMPLAKTNYMTELKVIGEEHTVALMRASAKLHVKVRG